MRTGLGIGTVLLAASLTAPAAFGQVTTVKPGRTRNATTITTSSGYLGIGAQDIDSERAKALKLAEVRGCEITSVMGSHALRAFSGVGPAKT